MAEQGGPGQAAAATKVRGHHWHVAQVINRGWGERRRLAKDVDGFNARTAVLVTNILGSMPFFWLSNLLAVVSLPAVLTAVDHSLKSTFPAWLINASLITLVAWIAQTYIQLVALPVLQVSGNAQGNALAENTRTLLSEVAETRADAQRLLDAMDLDTAGGLTAVLAAIDDLRADLVGKSGQQQCG